MMAIQTPSKLWGDNCLQLLIIIAAAAVRVEAQLSAAYAYPPYIVATAETWDDVAQQFTDGSGAGRHGVLASGVVSSGSAPGNGANIDVPFVGGGTSAKIHWPAGSIASDFTICSITRYSGASKKRILQGSGANWLHGHHNADVGVAYYNGWNLNGNANANVAPNAITDWLVMCGSNGLGSPVRLNVNGVSHAVGGGTTGDIQLMINDGNVGSQASDWQLSKLYVWDSHLPDETFAQVASELNGYLAGDVELSVSAATSGAAATTEAAEGGQGRQGGAGNCTQKQPAPAPAQISAGVSGPV